MTERESSYLICRMENVGPVYYDRLLAYYGTAEAAWQAKTPPLSGKAAAEWQRFHEPETEARFRRELEGLAASGCRFLTRGDAEFPEAFRPLHDCPIGLFVRGRLPDPAMPAVAIVGARRCTPYGRNAAERFGRELAERGVAVISGMAEGIDAAGQWGALRAGGLSVAVLGSGIDVCYPRGNRGLYERLAEEGGILSEYGPGEAGLPFHFPVRNRLISALAQVVLVMEARERSGSLITVDRALEQGRDVLALPGRVGDPLSAGCNHLIRQGAGILTCVEDICEALHLEEKKARHESAKVPEETLPAELSEDTQRVYELLAAAPVHQDALAAQLGWPVPRILETLWELEAAGLCRAASSGTYLRDR